MFNPFRTIPRRSDSRHPCYRLGSLSFGSSARPGPESLPRKALIFSPSGFQRRPDRLSPRRAASTAQENQTTTPQPKRKRNLQASRQAKPDERPALAGLHRRLVERVDLEGESGEPHDELPAHQEGAQPAFVEAREMPVMHRDAGGFEGLTGPFGLGGENLGPAPTP